MILNGITIAATTLEESKKIVDALRQKNVVPHLAVMLIGDDVGSLSYIRQKQKMAEAYGIHVTFCHLAASTPREQIYTILENWNADSSIHGIIIQRPIPPTIPEGNDLIFRVDKKKDVDGFLPDSPFPVPVAQAILEILAYSQNKKSTDKEFLSWLTTQKITIIGRGSTAGKPIAELLQKLQCTTSIISRDTQQPKQILLDSSIIISCVGREQLIGKTDIQKGVILISVGLSRNAAGKLTGDYDQEEVAAIASFYTPTPGGVGPVNVSCLMKNVVSAALQQTI